MFGVGLRRKDDELHLARCLTERERRGGRGYKEENEEEEEKKLSRRVYITVEQLMKDPRCVGEPQPFCCFSRLGTSLFFSSFTPAELRKLLVLLAGLANPSSLNRFPLETFPTIRREVQVIWGVFAV